jgi:hypothetical protein
MDMKSIATLTVARNSMTRAAITKLKSEYADLGMDLIVIEYNPAHPVPQVDIRVFPKG